MNKPKPLTNPSRPVARYRKGKPIAPVPDSDSDSDAAANDEAAASSDEDTKPTVSSRQQRPTAASLNVSLKGVEVDDKGLVTVGGKGEVGKTQRELESEEEEDESSEEEEDEVKPKPAYKMPTMPGADSDDGSSEYETDSADDEPAKPIYKPVFVSKRNRDTIAERDAALDPDLLEERRLAELESRKQESHDLVAESILRELAAKEVEHVFPDVDDTDGLDPTAEFDAWKLRELMRIKRDREAQYAREKEREEVEARRALPEALRMKEDMDRAQKTRDEKSKGNQVFLQKYHHKGAFYTDTEVLKKHDYTAPTTSTNRNVESLPAVMQKRNFGKAHQTKYTHLADQDTTNAGSGTTLLLVLSL
ncbi:hypothetical protein RQP46_009801 [Phenoliferia psychrophenolica]